MNNTEKHQSSRQPKQIKKISHGSSFSQFKMESADIALTLKKTTSDNNSTEKKRKVRTEIPVKKVKKQKLTDAIQQIQKENVSSPFPTSPQTEFKKKTTISGKPNWTTPAKKMAYQKTAGTNSTTSTGKTRDTKNHRTLTTTQQSNRKTQKNKIIILDDDKVEEEEEKEEEENPEQFQEEDSFQSENREELNIFFDEMGLQELVNDSIIDNVIKFFLSSRRDSKTSQMLLRNMKKDNELFKLLSKEVFLDQFKIYVQKISENSKKFCNLLLRSTTRIFLERYNNEEINEAVVCFETKIQKIIEKVYSVVCEHFCDAFKTECENIFTMIYEEILEQKDAGDKKFQRIMESFRIMLKEQRAWKKKLKNSLMAATQEKLFFMAKLCWNEEEALNEEIIRIKSTL